MARTLHIDHGFPCRIIAPKPARSPADEMGRRVARDHLMKAPPRIILAILGLTACGWAIAGYRGMTPAPGPTSGPDRVFSVLSSSDTTLVLLPIRSWWPARARRPLVTGLAQRPIAGGHCSPAAINLRDRALPFVLGKGRTADNPSALPLTVRKPDCWSYSRRSGRYPWPPQSGDATRRRRGRRMSERRAVTIAHRDAHRTDRARVDGDAQPLLV